MFYSLFILIVKVVCVSVRFEPREAAEHGTKKFSHITEGSRKQPNQMGDIIFQKFMISL